MKEHDKGDAPSHRRAKQSDLGGPEKGVPSGMEMKNEGQASAGQPADIAAEGSPTISEETEELRRQVEAERTRAESYLANWQRAQADFINYRRRSEQERTDAARFANAMLILNLLTVLDDLERALATVPTGLAGFTWFDGLYLIHRKFLAVLEAQGLKEIKAEGEDFDPSQHEATMFDAEGPEGKVTEVLQKGYKLHERVIRPAMVKVGQRKEQASAQGEGERQERE